MQVCIPQAAVESQASAAAPREGGGWEAASEPQLLTPAPFEPLGAVAALLTGAVACLEARWSRWPSLQS